MYKPKIYIDNFFKDKKGHTVIFQAPNIPIIAYFIFTILNLIFSNGSINLLLKVLAFGAIFTWSYLELFQGVNSFRRLLGLVILIGCVSSMLTYMKGLIPN